MTPSNPCGPSTEQQQEPTAPGPQQRLDDDDYPTPFDALADWHLLRALAIHRPELARPYVHLVDSEPFDEE